MRNQEYWKKRFLQLENKTNFSASQTKSFVDEQYKTAVSEIEKQILVWYARFAKNNEISISETRRWLSEADLKELKWDIQEYIKHGSENGITADWSKELENASAKFHISKLEALKLQTQMTCDRLFGKQMTAVTAMLKNTYLESYYHSAYEIQHGLKIGWDIAALDENRLAKILNRPWATDGKTFSGRIWTNRVGLVSEMHKQLTQDILLGRSPDKSIKAIAKKFSTSRAQAGRLIMTESTYFSSEAQKDCFKNLDVEKFEVVETLDNETCSICTEMDGKVFDMKEFVSGTTAPPYHPWCRGCTVPYFDDNYTERAARNADGKTYYVPGDMNYDEWKKKFVDTHGLGANDDYDIVPKHDKPKLLKRIDTSDENVILSELRKYEDAIATEKIENAIVITKDGEVWHCFGIANRVFPDDDLGDKLYGAYVTHSHPIEETEYSFSEDDYKLFERYKLPLLRGVDEKYIYEFNRNSNYVDETPEDWMTEENYRHAKLITEIENLNIGYRRWKK